VRSPDDLYYATELPGPETTVVYTRSAPASSDRRVGRLTAADIPVRDSENVTAYVCGSSGFCDAATDLLVAGGLPVARIRVERFGPTG
jgi:ferredoxin-NADP reductase